eukprot:7285042-Pyramimonas_sp.AAC.2
MNKVAKHVKDDVVVTPPRFNQILMMDVNDRFQNGEDGDETVGPFPTGRGGDAAKLHHNSLLNAYMAVANTYYDTANCDGRRLSLTDSSCTASGL